MAYSKSSRSGASTPFSSPLFSGNAVKLNYQDQPSEKRLQAFGSKVSKVAIKRNGTNVVEVLSLLSVAPLGIERLIG